MNQTFAKVFSATAMPVFLLVLALAVQGAAVPGNLAAVAGYGPYVVAVLGISLCAWFKCSRGVFAFALTVLGFWVVDAIPAPGMADGVHGRVVYAGYAVLAPLNLAWLCLADERGVLTTRGLMQIAAILFQVLVFAMLATALAGTFAPGTAASLPQPALLTCFGALLALSGRAVSTGQPMDASLVGAMGAVALGLHSAGAGVMPAVFFTTAGLILIGAVIQASYRMAFLDELTGIPARRALMAELKKVGRRYTIAMVDVDHFKKFNDTYGHDVGDDVLRMVAGKLARVGGGGRAFRYGGEEFTLLFPSKTADEAWRPIEAARTAIAGTRFCLRGTDRPDEKPDRALMASDARDTINVTVSIGVAERGGDGASPEEIMKAADRALYRAKDGGRNRTERWDPELPKTV